MSKCDPQKKELAAADNRALFPATALIVDEFRAAFGDGVKLVYAEEGGRTIGRKPAEPKRWVTADGRLKGSALVAAELARRNVKQELKGRAR